jgi:DinB superfamily
MPNDLALTLQETVERESAQLSRLTEADAAVKGSSPVWSKKEELGHLIDSAANNHVRFVRASLEPEFRGPTYQQNGWVDRHGYNEMPWKDIVEFWRRYNAILAAVVRRIPEDRMQTPCVIGDSAPVTLRFLIEDYVLHMQHHLDHILRRDKLTQYPGAALGV